MEAIYLYFLSIIILCFLTKNLLSHGRRLPPSPAFSLPIIGHLHLFKKPLHRSLAELADRHGPVLSLRFGSRPVVLVTSPSVVEECFTKNDVTFANRPRFLAGKHLGYGYTTLVWVPYGDHWRNLRRIASLEILSSQRLQMYHNIRTDEVRLLIRRLFHGSEKGGFQEVDMRSAFFELLLNVMMRMIAGKRYYGENVEELEEARNFKDIVTETFRLSGATNIVDFIPFLRWVGLGGRIEKRLIKLQEKRDRFMRNLIQERKRMKQTPVQGSSRTMIDVLLSLQETQPEYYVDEIVCGIIIVLLTAGTDTSAGTMEWALSLLVNNPEALLKAQVEIDTLTGQSRFVDESDLSDLPYLQGIINETLRMYPAAPLLPAHESSEDCSVGGFSVPRGTMLLVNMRGIQNSPKYWADPKKFRPERFEMDRAKEEREGYRLVPFGAGRRGCPGEGLAMRMVGLTLGTLIQCFEWERVGKDMVDMSEGPGLTMPKLHPLVAKCRPRSTILPLLSQL